MSTTNSSQRVKSAALTSNLASSCYEATLKATTRYGAMTATLFEIFFSIYYWFAGFPIQVVWLNVVATVITVLGWLILGMTRFHRAASHLILFGVYVSLVGPGLYTGGIEATSMVWLVFIPVVATIMAGRQATMVWGIVSLTTAVGIFVLNQIFMIDLTIRPPQSTDRIVDLVSVILVMITAAWLNETTKVRSISQLEATQVKLMELATIDPLTQANNRRYFMEQAHQKDRKISHDSILLFDLDHFKTINDSYSHEIGDRILQEVCLLCKAQLRETDILARFGGEKFVILLPNTDLRKAKQIAQRLCEETANTPVITSQNEIRVTVSMGAASRTPMNQVRFETLLSQADQAMYQAKHFGRNRVFVWQLDADLNDYLRTSRARTEITE
jgi:diguanylate cyclase (GGDEF)-like protein